MKSKRKSCAKENSEIIMYINCYRLATIHKYITWEFNRSKGNVAYGVGFKGLEFVHGMKLKVKSYFYYSIKSSMFNS